MPTITIPPKLKFQDLNASRSLLPILAIVLYMPRAKLFIVSKTALKPFERPLISPDIMNSPNSIKSFDGDAIPRILQNVSIIAFPRFLIIDTALEIPERMPEASPCVILIPKFFQSRSLMLSFNLSKNEIMFCINETNFPPRF